MATTSTRLILPFVRVMDRMGKQAVKPSLEDLGLSRAALVNPGGRLSHRHAVALLQEALRVTERPELGLLAAQAVEPAELEIWEYAIRTQPDIRRGLDRMRRLFALMHSGSRLEIDDDGNAVSIRWQLDPGLEQLPAMIEFGLGLGLVAWRRALRMERLAVSEVLLPYPAPPDTSLHHAVFQSPIRFDAPFAGLTFPARVLDRPMPQADDVLAEILVRHGEDRISNLPKPDLVDRVEALIVDGLSSGEFTATDVARRLHMSSRTLQRRLEQDGLTFRGVLDDTRRRLALSHLRDKHVSVNEIAFLLGFASPSAFHKAFKRWTGTSAGAVRQAGTTTSKC